IPSPKAEATVKAVAAPAAPAGGPTDAAPSGAVPAAPPAGGPGTPPAGSGSGPSGGPRTGDLTFLDTNVQQGLGTVRLRATLPNADRYFWPGQFVNVRLILETRKGAVLVPQQAVQVGQKGPFVYVVKADNTADMRQVSQGQRQDDLVVVESGVAAGERVIVTGQTFIGPGAPVHVAGDPPPAGGAPGGAAPGAAAGGQPKEGAAAK
ncbi:MAG: family efflux transporter, subunit, partial [Phycisphaerales bacterium]|nr:family efflux transporter, subunit [Phycisphaerales bacterium]